MHKLARLDQRYVWHPFTQMKDWLKTEPIVIVSGQGSVLRDVHGREYIDANSSIWTNLHGHNHPKLNAAIGRQLKKIAHSSALGLANEPASLLAERLVASANSSPPDPPRLCKVFFSDDGSTAVEVALKLAYQYARRSRGVAKPRFLSLEGGYHGDTIGAVSLGHVDLFHSSYSRLLFKTDSVMAPYCYRCPFNRAAPERADARAYRKCNWECVGKVEQVFAHRSSEAESYSAFVVEPLMQGAAGMIPQPAGWLPRVCEIARAHKAQIIADEVMTGFGRTGVGDVLTPERVLQASRNAPGQKLFATSAAEVAVDYLCLAKGLTGGYLPMAATLTTQEVFDGFLGDYAEFKTFFHGHSFTGNQLGAAAGLASLDVLRTRESVLARTRLQQDLEESVQTLWDLPNVGDIRQVGLVAGVELVRDWRTRQTFDVRQRIGARVCAAMAQRGVLTRPVGDVVVIMPPYCTTSKQVSRIRDGLRESISEIVSQV